MQWPIAAAKELTANGKTKKMQLPFDPEKMTVKCLGTKEETNSAYWIMLGQDDNAILKHPKGTNKAMVNKTSLQTLLPATSTKVPRDPDHRAMVDRASRRNNQSRQTFLPILHAAMTVDYYTVGHIEVPKAGTSLKSNLIPEGPQRV
eukprot:jgi/Psemu1/48869/gm1.48869_g